MPKPKNVGGRPRIDPREKRVASTFALAPSVLKQIEQAANEQGVSKSEVLNVIVRASTIVSKPAKASTLVRPLKSDSKTTRSGDGE